MKYAQVGPGQTQIMLGPCLQSWPCREKSPRQGVHRPQPLLPLPLNSLVGLWASHLLPEPQHLHHFRNRAVTKGAGVPLREHPHTHLPSSQPSPSNLLQPQPRGLNQGYRKNSWVRQNFAPGYCLPQSLGLISTSLT